MRRSRSRLSVPTATAILAASMLLALPCIPAARAQSFEDERFNIEYFEPPPGDAGPGAPSYKFNLVNEIPLPGPLPGAGPHLQGDRIAIAVAGGTVLASSDGESEFQDAGDPAAEAPLPGDELAVGISPDGRFRAVPLERGFILAQKRCERCRTGWRKRWKVRAPGSEFARPVVTDSRVYYGTTDNRVYSVKRKNGHRVWVTDVKGRVLRPLERLQVPASPNYVGRRPQRLLDLILVIPDSGASILALDGRTGARVATFELPENETLVGWPLPLPEGRIAVALQKYNAREASLLVLSLDVPVLAPDSEESEESGESEDKHDLALNATSTPAAAEDESPP